MPELSSQIQEPRNLRRSQYLAILGILLGAALVVSYASNWFFYRQVRDEMRGQMRERLLASALVVAQAIDVTDFTVISVLGRDSPEFFETHARLDSIRTHNSLQNITLVSLTSDGAPKRILDLAEFDRLDATDKIIDPASGSITHDPVLRSELRFVLDHGGVHVSEIELRPPWQASYAAIVDPVGATVGAVVVEGGEQFFAALPKMRERVLASAWIGLAAVVLLGFLFFRVLRSFVRLEDSLRSTAALAAVGQISSIVAHEIKNPLAILRSRSERVRAKIEAGKDREEILEWFEAIPAEVDRLNDIVTNYLSLARPGEAGDDRCRVSTVVEETTRLLGDDLEKRKIDLTVELSAVSKLEAEIGRGALKQVMLNLILNAAQAIEGTGSIAISGRLRERWIEISISDDGRGMTAEERTKVLEPFYTTKPTGSGLGLTLVQTLVHGRKGLMEIESTVGRGTCVRVLLPASA